MKASNNDIYFISLPGLPVMLVVLGVCYLFVIWYFKKYFYKFWKIVKIHMWCFYQYCNSSSSRNFHFLVYLYWILIIVETGFLVIHILNVSFRDGTWIFRDLYKFMAFLGNNMILISLIISRNTVAYHWSQDG